MMYRRGVTVAALALQAANSVRRESRTSDAEAEVAALRHRHLLRLQEWSFDVVAWHVVVVLKVTSLSATYIDDLEGLCRHGAHGMHRQCRSPSLRARHL